MNNKRLNAVIREHSDSLEEGGLGYWRYVYHEMLMLTITDEGHNRMRIISPVALAKDVSNSILRECMEANFDRALDARFALSGDHLWSVFIHPFEELSEKQFVDGMNQVATLAANYGTSFSSSDLLFGGGD